MDNQQEPLSQVVVASYVIRNAQPHAQRWEEKGLALGDVYTNAIRMDALLEEVEELRDALAGNHEHPPQLELLQIGGIVFNWLRLFPREAIDSAFQQIESEHPHG